MAKLRLRLSLSAWRRLALKIGANGGNLNPRLSVLYWLSSPLYSVLGRIQRKSHASALENLVQLSPIFVLGFWRSGTTFLHELLCCDPRFGFPSTYACMNPSHFLLTEHWIRNRPPGQQTRRPMDNMKYSWDSPQEDEFALFALGAPSPYEALLAPSLMRDPRLLLDLNQRPVEDQVRWSSFLQYFLQLLTVQQAKTIVLKSPSHGFRLSRLHALFPQARYVIIERNPYEVFASNLKLWQTLLELYSLQPFSITEIEDFVLSAYVLHEEAICHGARSLDGRYVAHVRYEDLVTEPLAQMKRLYRELELGRFEEARPALEHYLVGVADYKRNSFSLSIAQKEHVSTRWGAIIDAKRYAWPSDRLGVG
ncbi:MAG TPA: sulfotransferase [Terriglobales bacterium]|nr:sulfotransferase [Terriglobales bacterium]